jgi:hypothetical protein
MQSERGLNGLLAYLRRLWDIQRPQSSSNSGRWPAGQVRVRVRVRVWQCTPAAVLS